MKATKNKLQLGGVPLSCVLGLALCLQAAMSSSASAVSFSDGTFNTADWQFSVLQTVNGGSVTAAQIATGGNPGANREVSTHVNSNPVGPKSTVFAFHSRNGATYDPSASLPISTIDFSIDYKQVSSNIEQFGLAIRQNGNIFRAASHNSSVFSWLTQQDNNLSENDFGLIQIVGSNILADTDFSQNPDFSSLGSEIEFGFFTSALSSGATVISRHDNWNVTIHEVPEPATMGLLGLGSLVLWRRRRAGS